MGKLRAICGSIQTKHKSLGQQHLDSYLDPAACLYEVPNPCNNAVRDLHEPMSQQSCRLLRLVTWAWLFSFLNQAVQAEVRARPGRWCRAGSQHHLGGTVATLHTAGSKKSQSKLRCEMIQVGWEFKTLRVKVVLARFGSCNYRVKRKAVSSTMSLCTINPEAFG